MKYYILVTFILISVSSKLHSQDGKLIMIEPYIFSDTSIPKYERILTNTKLIISEVNFYKITYLSDGLLIQVSDTFKIN